MGDYAWNNQQKNQSYYPQQQNQPYYPQQQNQPYYPQQNQPYYPQQQPAYSPPNYANTNTASNAALNSGGNGAGFHPEKFTRTPKYNDIWAAILFFVHLAGFVVLSYFAITAFRNPPAGFAGNGGSSSGQLSSSVVVALVITVLTAFGLSAIYMTWMERCASTMIKATFIASIAFYFAFAAYLFVIGALIPAIFAVIFAVIYLLCWFWWRSRIPFATIMLETVTSVTKKYRGLFGATIVGSILQMVYTVYFLVTLVGVIYMTTDKDSDCTITVNSKGQVSKSCPSSGKRTALLLFSSFSYYWVSQVIKSTVHVTVSGVFAAYYFLEGSAEGVPSSPTISSAKRALTTSFGSICYGSLIIAIIRVIKQTLRSAANNSENQFGAFIATCAVCLLDWIESLVQYFNHYAYTQVAIYGKDFCTAAKDTWALIKDRGIEAIINDNLIGNVLSMGAILVGGINALLILLYLKITNAADEEVFIISILGFVVGFAMMVLVGEIIESGTATTFVALAEDPQALARTKPVLFEKIRQTYPEVVVGV